jgi:phosphatidylglycerophosphate synthase
MLCTMISVARSIRLSERQIGKLSDLYADAAQVFLASILLPSLGIGGAIQFSTVVIGIILTSGFACMSLYLLRPYRYEQH